MKSNEKCFYFLANKELHKFTDIKTCKRKIEVFLSFNNFIIIITFRSTFYCITCKIIQILWPFMTGFRYSVCILCMAEIIGPYWGLCSLVLQVNWHDFAFFDPVMYESLRQLIRHSQTEEAEAVFAAMDLAFAIDLCKEEGAGQVMATFPLCVFALGFSVGTCLNVFCWICRWSSWLVGSTCLWLLWTCTSTWGDTQSTGCWWWQNSLCMWVHLTFESPTLLFRTLTIWSILRLFLTLFWSLLVLHTHIYAFGDLHLIQAESNCWP